eukprot:1546358-Prymnesium_polylepis.1
MDAASKHPHRTVPHPQPARARAGMHKSHNFAASYLGSAASPAAQTYCHGIGRGWRSAYTRAVTRPIDLASKRIFYPCCGERSKRIDRACAATRRATVTAIGRWRSRSATRFHHRPAGA